MHNTTVHYTTRTIHYTILVTPHHNYKLQLQLYTHTNYTILQIQIHYSTLQTTNYNCATPHYIKQLWVRWPLQPLQPLQKNTTPNHLSVHQWILPLPFRDSQQPTSLTGFLFLKLPPPPCVVQLVIIMKSCTSFSPYFSNAFATKHWHFSSVMCKLTHHRRYKQFSASFKRKRGYAIFLLSSGKLAFSWVSENVWKPMAPAHSTASPISHWR